MLQPKSIAIIGATERPGLASNLLKACRNVGFIGAIYPVNPKYKEVSGLRCYPRIEDVPGPVDVAAIAVSSRLVIPAVESCGAHNVGGVVVMSGGFGEGEGEGQDQFLALRQAAERHGIPLLGPNCIGYANLPANAAVWGGSTLGTAKPGHVSLVTQSGSPAIAVAAHRFGIGCRVLINTGNEAGLDIATLVDLLVSDEATHTIAVYLEELKHPDLFLRAAANAERAGKPIIVFKGGSTEQGSAAAAAHTASLAGDPQIYAAIFEQAGVVQVHDFDEFLETVYLFSSCVLPKGNRIGVITGSGGLKVMASDAFDTMDLVVPELSEMDQGKLRHLLPTTIQVSNPLDLTAEGLASASIQTGCVDIMARSDSIDLLCIHPLVPHAGLSHASALASKATDKPVVFVMSNASQPAKPDIERILHEAGIPQVHGTLMGFRAVSHLATYTGRRADRQAAQSTHRRVVNEDRARARLTQLKLVLEEKGAGALSEMESKQLLQAYDIPVTKELLAKSSGEAIEHARSLGFPVVMKIASAEIVHKTEIGGVLVNVRSGDEVAQGYDALMARARSAFPQARIDGVLVQEMVQGGVETILGVSNDPRLGPMILVGLGGIYVEILKDCVFRRAPLTARDPEQMVRRLRAFPILAGARGRPAVNFEVLYNALLSLSDLAIDLGPRLGQIDINPFVVSHEGGMALDAVITLA